MAESTSKAKTEQGQPPAAGRQDHDAMRAASMTPVTGGASTDSLAASGGLNVPGGDTHHHVTVPTQAAVPEPIPGERDATTLTHRQPGAMGSYTGAELPSPGPGAWVDQPTEHDRVLEGGGEGQHHHHPNDNAKGGNRCR